MRKLKAFKDEMINLPLMIHKFILNCMRLTVTCLSDITCKRKRKIKQNIQWRMREYPMYVLFCFCLLEETTKEEIQMNMKKTIGGGALLGAAFLMATSSVGPATLTQTAVFTETFYASFGFVILAGVILAAIAQLNIWRVLCVSGMRGQDIANKLLPGLGYFISFLIVLGGLAFNIGNVGGAALGMNSLLGINTTVATVIGGVLAIVVFLFKQAKEAMDIVAKLLGALMIVLIFVVILIVKPPMGEAIKNTVAPSTGVTPLFPAILTILGGTVGGYVTFAGAHRLIDAGITGEDNLSEITKSSMIGIVVTAIVWSLLFLAILGVVVKGVKLDPANPAADAFLKGAGQIGYRFLGLVLIAAGVTSIIGAAYTSVSFLKTFNPWIEAHENGVIIAFIAVSTLVMTLVGNPPHVHILAGAFNGLILPLALAICLVAARSKKIMGENYKHPVCPLILGWVVVVMSAYVGVETLVNNLGSLLHL